MTPESPFAVPTIATIPANTSSAEARSTLARLHDLAQEQENFQSRLAALREERDSLILRGLAHGLSSSALAATSHLTGARVRAIADAAASSSARERVSRAIGRLVEHKPAVCTTYGALAAAVGIGSAKGVASSLSTNPGVSAREGARVLAPGGLLLVNTSSVPRSQAGAEIQALREALEGKASGLVIVADPAAMRGRRRGNLVLVARPDPFTAGELEEVERAVRRLPLPVRTWSPDDAAVPRPEGVLPR